MTPVSLLNTHQHFFLMGLGVDRLCEGTLTVFGPGFVPVRCGRHLAFLSAIAFSFLYRRNCRVVSATRRKRDESDGCHRLFQTVSKRSFQWIADRFFKVLDCLRWDHFFRYQRNLPMWLRKFYFKESTQLLTWKPVRTFSKPGILMGIWSYQVNRYIESFLVLILNGYDRLQTSIVLR